MDFHAYTHSLLLACVLALSLSLFLSLSLTHTHTLSLALSRSFALAFSLSLPLSPSHSFSLALSCSLSLFRSFFPSVACALSHTRPNTNVYRAVNIALSFSLLHALSLKHTCLTHAPPTQTCVGSQHTHDKYKIYT